MGLEVPVGWNQGLGLELQVAQGLGMGKPWMCLHLHLKWTNSWDSMEKERDCGGEAFLEIQAGAPGIHCAERGDPEKLVYFW